MRKLSIAFFSGILLAAPLAPLSAQNVLISGNAMNANSGMTTALTSLGASYTVVSPFDFGTTSFTGYNVIWLDGFSQYSPGTPGNPGLVSANLISFMDTGGVVFVQNPGFGSERFAAYPFGSELGASF